jgi:hypothetical protein
VPFACLARSPVSSLQTVGPIFSPGVRGSAKAKCGTVKNSHGTMTQVFSIMPFCCARERINSALSSTRLQSLVPSQTGSISASIANGPSWHIERLQITSSPPALRKPPVEVARCMDHGSVLVRFAFAKVSCSGCLH